MKFRCEREVLANALGAAARAAKSESLSSMAPQSGLRLELSGNTLYILGSDMEISIRLTLDVAGEEDGVALVRARLFADIARALPPGAVHVETRGDEEMVITAGRSEFAIRIMTVAEYPVIAEPSGEAVALTAGEMAKALRQVVRAAGTDVNRQVLTGVLIAADDDGARMVATDGYRLAVRNLSDSQLLQGAQRVLIPGRALTELQRLVSDEADLRVTLGARDAVFESGGVRLTTRLIEGDYPNYRGLIPPPLKNVLTADRTSLLDALRRVKILAPDKTPVRLQLATDEVVLRAVTPELGDAHEALDGSYDGEEMTIAFNADYLISGVDALESDEVRIEIEAPMKAAVLRGSGHDNYLYLLMPQRVP